MRTAPASGACPAGQADVAVVVPAYNEATVVGDVVRQLRTCFANVVCVDDGSRDGTADQAAAAGAEVVRHPFNMGAGAALRTGIEYVLPDPRIRYVLTFDADGQHEVVDAVAMVGVLRSQQVDVVLGSRFLQPGAVIPRGRRLLLRVALRYSNLTTGVRLTDVHNGLRAMTADAARSLDFSLPGMAYASELTRLLGRRGLRIVEHSAAVRYTAYSRGKGQPAINSVNILFDLLNDRVFGTK